MPRVRWSDGVQVLCLFWLLAQTADSYQAVVLFLQSGRPGEAGGDIVGSGRLHQEHAETAETFRGWKLSGEKEGMASGNSRAVRERKGA